MKLVYYILLVICLLGISPASLHAQEKQDFSVSLDPAIIEIEATPPATPEVKIKVRNRTENEANLSISFKPFTMREDGQIEYLSTKEAKRALAPLGNRLKIYDGDIAVTAVKLSPLESKELTLKADITNRINSNDYYIALVFSQTSTSPQKSTVGTSGGIASLMILSIAPGQTMGRISEFEAPIFTQGPVPFKVLLGNDSNHYIIPRGRITITDITGKIVGRVDILPQYLLANSERYLSDTDKKTPANELIWPERFLLGIYKAEASVRLSENGPTVSATRVFISLPILIILIVTTLSFVTCAVIYKAIKKAKRK